MDRTVAYMTILLVFTIWLIRERNNLTYSKGVELLVGGYIFSCAFPRIQIPVYDLPFAQHWGTFLHTFKVMPYLALFPVFIVILAYQLDWKIQRPNIKVILSFIAFFLYVIFNPFNVVTMSALIPLFYIAIYFCFLKGLSETISLRTIINGVYRGLVWITGLNFVLAILFPVLGIRFATQIYFATAVVRSLARAGAVGTFSHPNNLAVFMSYAYVFFVACWVVGFKKTNSRKYAIIAAIVVFLSGSRSALLAITVSSIAIVILYKFIHYNFFSSTIFLKVVAPAAVGVTLLLTFTPLNDMFFGSDVDAQVINRSMHYLCGFEIFSDHPIVGVGLNSHLKYLNDNVEINFNDYFDSTSGFDFNNEFMFSSPIHNSWLIILCETGLIGLIFTIYYVGRFLYKFKPRIRRSKSMYYTVVLVTTLGIFFNFIIHGNTDWAPLTIQELNISLLFIFLAANDSYGENLEDEHIVYKTKLM